MTNATTHTFRILNTIGGVDFGLYEGTDADDAYRAFLAEAGDPFVPAFDGDRADGIEIRYVLPA
jgi:hypothetical protein